MYGAVGGGGGGGGGGRGGGGAGRGGASTADAPKRVARLLAASHVASKMEPLRRRIRALAIIPTAKRSKKECGHLISLAKPHMTRSRVVDVNAVGGKESSSRTSTGMFLSRGRDKVIGDI
ncbi:hypothetical protein HU200_057289 [Digitaria exilis]|uniref:Uncharacterized protein n=1 Tax=Digitaria exilis TaxID=1010633 RepID=A0A835E385_9POAL|nr:hypothetical protein HU200_057289 [Digitaria exilis]